MSIQIWKSAEVEISSRDSSEQSKFQGHADYTQLTTQNGPPWATMQDTTTILCTKEESDPDTLLDSQKDQTTMFVLNYDLSHKLSRLPSKRQERLGNS